MVDTIGHHSGEPGLKFLNYQDQRVPWQGRRVSPPCPPPARRPRRPPG
ncbi:hypothetical protein [Streptomyces sp. NPDC091212]